MGELVSRSDHSEAAILVVGRVTGLREHLRWFDTRPLFGRRVVVTRPRAQATELVSRLEQLGANAIEVPTIQILPPEDPTPLDEACARVESFDWIVFTSANAVSHFMRHLLAGANDVRALQGVRLCAIGPVTAEALSGYGLKIDLVPEKGRSEGIIQAMCRDCDVTDSQILLPRGDLALDLLPSKLQQAGARVTTVTAYRTAPVNLEEGGPDIYRLLLEQGVDIVTFTSGSSVKNFARALGEEQTVDLLARVDVACIGPVTADVADQLGIKTTIMPSVSTVASLVDAIVAHTQSRATRTED